jgi:RsiW-degrading membrane proteinase PrsW (M82 family)
MCLGATGMAEPEIPGTAHELAELAKLRKEGVLSESEFTRLKDAYLEKSVAASAQTSAEKFRIAARAKEAVDLITDRLQLEKIDDFSFAKFFGDVFRKRAFDESERRLSVGFANTTPAIDETMSMMPSPWLFARVLVFSLLSYAIFYFAWQQFDNVKLIPGLIVIGSFAVPLSVTVLFYELNTPRNVSIVRVVQFMIAGGAASMLFALVLVDLTSLLGTLGPPAGGAVEECGKLGTVCVIYEASKNLRERYPYLLNGLLLGAAVGAGFAAFESAGYSLQIGFQDTDAMLRNIELRGLLSPFSHIVWTAIAAGIYWRRRRLHDTIWQTLGDRNFLLVFAVPVVLHALWDMEFQLPFYGKYILLGAVAWVVVISLVQSGLREVKTLAPAALAKSSVVH